MEAKAAAWDCRPGSEVAWRERTELRMERNLGLGSREEGVGGRALVVPIERLGEGGVVGRKVRMCDVVGEDGLGKTY